MAEVKTWLKETGWKKNPFTLMISPSLFVGYNNQVLEIQRHLQELHKLALIIGPTGAGKTTLLKWLENKLEDCSVIYLSKPPKKPKDFLDIFTSGEFSPSFFERIFKKRPSLYTLPDYLHKKVKDRQIVVLVDEVHEAPVEVLEWLRALNDHVENMSLVLSGLPIFEDLLKEKLETFNRRVTTKIELTTLTREETEELITKRIKNAGGKGLEPFSSELLDFVYMKTGGFPREILKTCDKIVNNAIKNSSFELKPLFSEPIKTRTESIELDSLPPKQRDVLEALINLERASPNELIEATDYSKNSNAIRSINNILKRLLNNEFVEREKKGRNYVYFPSSKINTTFVKN